MDTTITIKMQPLEYRRLRASLEQRVFDALAESKAGRPTAAGGSGKLSLSQRKVLTTEASELQSILEKI